MKAIIAFLFSLLTVGCTSTGHVELPSYLDARADSIFVSDHVSRITGGDGMHVSFLDYITHKHELIKGRGGEVIKQAGLVLKLKALEYDSTEHLVLFGTNSDTCRLLYSTVINSTKHGRSALTSVSNLLSGDANKKPQQEPYTSVDLIESNGTISWHDLSASFYFKHDYRDNRTILYEGWLVLDGDTIRARQFRDLRGEEGKLKKANVFYKYWLEMLKNGAVCAAFELSPWANKRVFISTIGQQRKRPDSRLLLYCGELYVKNMSCSSFVRVLNGFNTG